LQNELNARTRGADNADIKSKPNDAVPAAAKSTKSRPSVVVSNFSMRQSVDDLKIDPTEANLPQWNGLKNLDKYLWTLEAASRQSVDGLTNREISHLIFETFRENQAIESVNNLKTRIKSGHVRLTDVALGS